MEVRRLAITTTPPAVRHLAVSAPGPSRCQRWAGTTVVFAIALVGCGPPSVLQDAAASESAAVPTQSGASAAPSEPSVTPSAAVEFNNLQPGDGAEIACGDTGPIFSPSGEVVACGGELFAWPTMERLADLQGQPLSWGELDGTESLLLEVSRDTFATLDAAGTRHTVDTAGLEGQLIAEWAPGGDAVWLQSGIQTATLRLDSWTPAGRDQVASAANTITATNITASPDALGRDFQGRLLDIWMRIQRRHHRRRLLNRDVRSYQHARNACGRLGHR